MSKQQSKLIKQWQSKGYFVINLVKITPSGLPDLIACKPNEVIFIESKEKWDRLSALQKAKIKILKEIGFKIYVNDIKQ
ncbi:MAG: VRR-NUC domain-containing protein [Candidatus Babeliales bacterium]